MNEETSKHIAQWLMDKPDTKDFVEAAIKSNLHFRGAQDEASAITKEEATILEEFIHKTMYDFDLLCLVVAGLMTIEAEDGEITYHLTDAGEQLGM